MKKTMMITLRSALVTFGTTRVDNWGFTHEFPSQSMLTGLLGNALGYRRWEHEKLQALQDRLVFAARMDRRAPMLLHEYQTARMQKGERAWTPMGVPEERKGGADYRGQQFHIDYLQDPSLTVAIRLDPQDREPTLDDLREALLRPERPLFIGKKHSVPSCQIWTGEQEADTVLWALRLWPEGCGQEDHIRDLEEGHGNGAYPGFRDESGQDELIRVTWPPGEGAAGIRPENQEMRADLRNWAQGVHGGERRVLTGSPRRDEFFPSRERQEAE